MKGYLKMFLLWNGSLVAIVGAIWLMVQLPIVVFIILLGVLFIFVIPYLLRRGLK